MRLLFVADGRSPIALNWIEYFLAAGHEVHLASSFGVAQPDARLASYTFIPLAFSQAKGAGGTGSSRRRSGIWRAGLVGVRTGVRQALGALTLPAAASRLRALIAQIQPDLIHAMRIPFEGMLAATALAGQASRPPLLVSIWGNDFTLHARANPWMAALTRRCLAQADGLHSDCARDVRLAHTWGYPAQRPSSVLPGAGGIQTDIFYPADPPILDPIMIQPRGVRAYIANHTFFHALPLVLDRLPQARVICPNMAGQSQIEQWVTQMGLGHAVQLLPAVSRPRMAELFRSARVVVSPATHDGTPNTLLEAMACGCLPVAGEIESLREWIVPGENGLLTDISDPRPLAGALIRALTDAMLYHQAHPINQRLIAERADYARIMPQALAFYQQLVGLQRK